MLPLKISHIYNPENQSAEQLVRNFVIRENQYNKIYTESVETNLNESPQHFLIEGQRGTGKTTLLLRLQYELEKNKVFTVIRLPEEQYGIFSLFHLWQAVIDELDENITFDGLLDDFESFTQTGENDGYEIINNYIEKSNTRLILLLDNIGDMFKRFTDIELNRLRDIFHSTNFIQVIGASATTLESTYRYDKPFFEFFKRVRLGGLTLNETITLLERLAQSYKQQNIIGDIIKNNPQRVEILRRMTGGIPRTIVLLFEILVDQNKTVFEDLEVILDKVTPLYKHRMDDLPTQQQSIINAMALNWDGISSKEIVTSLKSNKFTSKKVSAQLKELEKQNIVEGKLINKKDKIYFIKERFFNIWYLMRFGRKKNRQRVIWLIRFLEQWCEPEEIKQKATLHLANLKNGHLKTNAAFIQAEALSALLEDNLYLQNKVLEKTSEYLINSDNQLAKNLSRSTLEKIELRVKANDPLSMTVLGDYYLNKVNRKDEGIILLERAIELGNENAMVILGYDLFITKTDVKKAEKLFKMAINYENNDGKYFLIWLYLQANIKHEYALKLSEDLFLQTKSMDNYKTLMIIQLWNDEYGKSYETFKELYKTFQKEFNTENITDYFIFLLAKDQYRLALELFDIFPVLQDIIKPVYYALMKFIQYDFPKEYLKMGSELKSTLEEILEKIKFISEKYNK